MREILFRGKTPSQDEHFDDGEWVQGFYTCFNGKEHRIYNGYAETDCGDYYPDWFNVRPETVGQYTGLTDKNGNKIFEGDIIQTKSNYRFLINYGEYMPNDFCKFEYKNWKSFGLFATNGKDDFQISNHSYLFEVIGNIHDNPELLRGGAKE